MKPNALDCTRFDFCYGSVWRTFKCDKGRYFSQSHRGCVPLGKSSSRIESGQVRSGQSVNVHAQSKLL